MAAVSPSSRGARTRSRMICGPFISAAATGFSRSRDLKLSIRITSSMRRATNSRVGAGARGFVAEPVEQRRGVDRRERGALRVPAEVVALVAEGGPDGVGGMPDRPGAVGGVVGQGEERRAAPHRLAVAGDELEPAHDRVGHPVAEAQAEQVGAGEVGGELGVLGLVEREREVDAAAREGEARQPRVDAGVLDGVGEGAVGPAVEGDVGQRRGDHRLAGGGEMVLLARPRLVVAYVAHDVGLPRILCGRPVDRPPVRGYIARSCEMTKLWHLERW